MEYGTSSAKVQAAANTQGGMSRLPGCGLYGPVHGSEWRIWDRDTGGDADPSYRRRKFN